MILIKSGDSNRIKSFKSQKENFYLKSKTVRFLSALLSTYAKRYTVIQLCSSARSQMSRDFVSTLKLSVFVGRPALSSSQLELDNKLF